MRLWPFRRRRAAPVASADDLILTEDLLRRTAEDVFAVRARQVRGSGIVFRGQLRAEPREALDVLLTRFRPLGYTPFLRAEGGEIVLQAWPTGAATGRQRLGVNVVLFVLTCLSTLLAGSMFSGSPTFDALRGASWLSWLVSGVPFAFTLLAILGVHEFGHYFTARHYGASVSLPYFIPAPPPFPFGTMGAIIRMRSPVRDRNSLFDIAAAGPLAGLAVAVPALLVGLSWSTIVPEPAEAHIVFGGSLLMATLTEALVGPIPRGMMLFTHPMADAAWVGFFVTALNLFPVGQLDGGRIAYALFGRRHRLVGVVTFAALLALGLVTGAANWMVWAVLLFFLVGLHHSPPLDDLTPLTPGRYVVGVICLILLVLLIPPVPLKVS
jgi:membrane-associated protease RseP (regulator of RpoE activity)